MIFLNLAVLLLLALVIFYAARQSSQPSQFSEHPLIDAKQSRELGESSKQKFDKGAYKDALRDADEALELDPNSHYLLWLRASIHNTLKNAQLAIEDCERILAKDDLYHWAYEQRGMAYLLLKRFDDARDDFEQAIILEKNALRSYLGLFTIAVEKKDETQAQAYIKRILPLFPDKSDGLKTSLQIAYNLKAYTLVINFVDEGIVKEKLSEEPLLSYRAWSHYYLKNYPQALADAERMLALNPENDVALRVKGYCYKATKDYEKAASAFQAFYDKEPDKFWIYYEYGICLWFLERYSELILVAQKLQELKADEAAFINLEGLVHSKLKEFGAAIEAYSKSISLNPDEGTYYDNRSAAYRCLKQFDKAWEDADKSLSLNPDSAHIYCNRAALFLIQDNPEAALENVNKAIELDADEEYTYATRAWIYLFVDNYELALADIQKARELAQDRNKHFHAIEAFIEASRGNHEQAQALWKTAANQEEKHWDEAWVITQYDLPEKLILLAQSLIKGR